MRVWQSSCVGVFFFLKGRNKPGPPSQGSFLHCRPANIKINTVTQVTSLVQPKTPWRQCSQPSAIFKCLSSGLHPRLRLVKKFGQKKMHLPYVCKSGKLSAPFPSGSQEKGSKKGSSSSFKSAIQDSNSSLVLNPKSRSSANILFFLCGPVGAPIARMGADVAFGIRVISRCIVHERTNAWNCACLRSAAGGHPR